MCNLGKFDCRALLNLWYVLEDFTTYNAEVGQESGPFPKTFLNVTTHIETFEENIGVKDLWNTSTLTFHSRLVGSPGSSFEHGDRQHFSLRWPATRCSCRNVQSVSISNGSMSSSHSKPFRALNHWSGLLLTLQDFFLCIEEG